MRKLIMTIGLPGSGKTTWSKEYQKNNPDTVLVSKDDLRAMLHSSVHSRGREDFILKVRDFVVDQALKDGHTVIVHDTNFSERHKARLSLLAKQNNAEFEVKDFTDVPIELCIQRDLKRLNSVGEQVIRKMYNDYLRPKAPVIERDPALPNAVVVDLDGTLALFGDANPYDRDFTQDQPNEPVLNLLHQIDFVNFNHPHQTEIIFLSGRQDKAREQTRSWLDTQGLAHYKQLYMRPTGDTRKDFIVKQELYEAHIKGKYNVLFILDDRNQVIDMWRSLGLTVFQVAEGAF